MTDKLTLTITLTPDELETLTPVLQVMFMTRDGLRPIAPDDSGPFGPPPAATAPWKGVAGVNPPGRVEVAIVPVAPAPAAVAPAAPAPVAPVASVPAVPVTVATTEAIATALAPAAVTDPEPVELDAEGYPWDDRIHSSSRAKLVKGGTWKIIRGADERHVETVRAELRARGFGVAPAAVAPAAPAPAAVAPAAPAPAAVAPAAPAPAIPQVPASAVAGACTTFPDFVKRVAVAKIPNETLMHALHAEGVEGLALLPANLPKIPAIAARLGL